VARILLLDEVAFSPRLVEVLEAHGHEVRRVTSEAEGLELLTGRPACDLILLGRSPPPARSNPSFLLILLRALGALHV
jgi:CheY-like chemotaxis protein